jgi:nucleotide-binding universal stress UspA family protein
MPEIDRPVVVVGWDFNESAEQVLAWAGDHARLVDGQLLLVHVLVAEPWVEVALPPLSEEQRRQMLAQMQYAATRAGVEARTEVVLASSASSALLELATAHHASLLCVGRNRTGLSRLLLGSVACQVARHSPVPVLVVPPGAGRTGAPTLLVGWDGSEHAEHALAWAASHARRTGGWTVLVHVVSPSEDLSAERARALQDELRDAARRHELEAQLEVVVASSPAEALLLAARRHDASMVCLGARGKGAVAGLLLGSVAERLAGHSELPVVLIR